MTSQFLPGPANQNLQPEKTKPKHLHRDWSGATVGLLFGMAGMFAGRLGQLWIGFDIFAQFWIQFVFLTLACALGMVSPRYKSLVGAVLFLSLIAGYSAWPFVASSGAAAKFTEIKSSERILKVASFNTFTQNQDSAAVVREVARLDADVITLVELNKKTLYALLQLRSQYPYQEDCFSTLDCDFAILSKYPLSDLVSKTYYEGAPYFHASLGPAFGNTTIIVIHTSRFPHQRSQLKQVLGLVKHIETIHGPVILMGDFNATPFSRITQTIVDGAGLERLTNLPSWTATYGFPQLAIDHVFVSSQIHALDHERIGEYAGSDHFPITITLAVPAK